MQQHRDVNAEPPEDPVVRLARTVAELETRIAHLEHAAPALRSRERARKLRGATAELETKLGTYWLSRIGIVSLITGTALLILTYFGQLGPVIRVALGYSIAAAVMWTGRWIGRRHALLGNVIFGGGLAIAYFVTYALHFIPAMRIIPSEAVGIALVGAAIAAIVVIAHRMQSETVAGIALYLGLHTGMLTDVTALTLVCTTMLAVGAVFFLAANRWVIVPISSVVAVYATHAAWALGGSSAQTPGLSVAFLSIDFLLFASATVIHPDIRFRSLAALSLLDWLGIVALGTYAVWPLPHDKLFALLCAIAAVQAGLAGMARIRNSPRSFSALQLALALVTLALALPVRLDGWPLVAGWIALGLTAALAARRAALPALGWIALAILVVVLAYPGLGALGAAAPLASALAFLAAERLHPPGDARAVPRLLLIAGVVVGLLRCVGLAAPAGFATLGWVGVAFVLFAIGFALHGSRYRWGGFAVLAAAAVRVLAVDLRHLSANERILTFVVAGVLLLVISFIYTRMRAAHAADGGPGHRHDSP